jgi:hypothetical protein
LTGRSFNASSHFRLGIIPDLAPVRIALIVAAADAEAALPTQNPAAMPPICYPQDVTTAMIEAFRRQ